MTALGISETGCPGVGVDGATLRCPPMTVRGARAVESADEAMATLIALLDGAWAVAGFAQLAGSAELVDGGLLAA